MKARALRALRRYRLRLLDLVATSYSTASTMLGTVECLERAHAAAGRALLAWQLRPLARQLRALLAQLEALGHLLSDAGWCR